MSKSRQIQRVKAARKPASAPKTATDFKAVLALIQNARARTVSTVNSSLIDLYWSIGDYISRKVATDGWGQGTVVALAEHIRRRLPNVRGFSAQNLWRMRQFHDVFRSLPKLSALLRELSWSHNLAIMSQAKRDEEREFYLRMSVRERWTLRQLERQLASGLFERVALSPVTLAPPMRDVHPDAASFFKDTYLIEFLDLPKDHSEADLHGSLVDHLKDFLIELGRDFCFVGSHYPVQVGKVDFEIDLLFFHRGLNCLIDIELKVEQFKPEHLGKLNFYLEALDRNVRKPHENPSIGVLLCATKDQEVVEYALSRSASPALVAEYSTRLPDKALLEAKLHEFYSLAAGRLTPGLIKAAPRRDEARPSSSKTKSRRPAPKRRPAQKRPN